MRPRLLATIREPFREPFRHQQRRSCGPDRCPRGRLGAGRRGRRAVPGHVRDADHGGHEVRAPVRHAPRPHHEPADHGDAARHGPGAAAHARGHALGMDGQHHVLHQPGRRRAGPDPVLGHRHPAPSRLRAAEPVHDAGRPADHHRAGHDAGGAGPRGQGAVRHRVPVPRPGRVRGDHPGPRPPHRRHLRDPLEVRGRRGRRPEQGRGRPGPPVRGPGRGGRGAAHHLRGRPEPLRRVPAVGPVLDGAAGRREGGRRAGRAADDQAVARVDAHVGLRGRGRATRDHRRVRPRAGRGAGRHRRLRDAGHLPAAVDGEPPLRHHHRGPARLLRR